MCALPAIIDIRDQRQRLLQEERELLRKLAALEERIRQFEDVDQPAYESWLSQEFGPELSTLEEQYAAIRAMRLRVQRIEDLIERKRLHPREALYEADRHSSAEATDESDAEAEQAARRQAKKEAKREARRAEKKEKRRAEHEARSHFSAPRGQADENPGLGSRKRLVTLYRTLARKLHPDSPGFVASDRTQRLWLDVQMAYESSDFERLLSISAWLEGPEGSLVGAEPHSAVLSLSEHQERNRVLGISRYRLQKTTARLAEHPAWEFTRGPATAAGRQRLRKRIAREIEQELERAQNALAAYEDFIESIGPPRAPRGKRR
jgi:hypothetical protein